MACPTAVIADMTPGQDFNEQLLRLFDELSRHSDSVLLRDVHQLSSIRISCYEDNKAEPPPAAPEALHYAIQTTERLQHPPYHRLSCYSWASHFSYVMSELIKEAELDFPMRQ